MAQPLATVAIQRGQETRHARTRTSGIRRLNRVKGTVCEVRFRDGEGRQRSRTFETMDEARASQNAALADVREGSCVPPTAGVVPFKVVAEQWFAAQLQLKRTQIKPAGPRSTTTSRRRTTSRSAGSPTATRFSRYSKNVARRTTCS